MAWGKSLSVEPVHIALDLDCNSCSFQASCSALDWSPIPPSLETHSILTFSELANRDVLLLCMSPLELVPNLTSQIYCEACDD